MTTEAMVSNEEREREQRIQAAKKKLKVYRAKQAQAAQPKQRTSVQLSAAQAKRISTNVANAVEASIVKAAEQAHTRVPSVSSSSNLENNATNTNTAVVAGHARSHSRNPSRAGHARGHSRVGSISISADSMAATAAAALRQSLNAAQPQGSGHAQRPSLTAAPSRPSSWLPNQQVHARTHSRTHSRTNSRASFRAPSLIGLAPSNSSSTLLAVEHGPGSFPAAKSGEWDDVEDQNGNGAQRRLSNRLSTGQPDGTDRPPSGSSSSHARRQSRHARKTSLSTKRESIELMGGLGYPSISVSQDNPVHNYRASRSISNRLSGIQPASVLFGGPPDRRSAARDFDWRGSFQGSEATVAHDGEDRLTALEKLEGRTRSASPSNVDGHLQSAQQAQLPPSPISPTPARPDRRSDLAHSRQSSVQLPSFDEIHGQDGMDKRSSTQLLEVNEQNTSDDSNIGAMSSSTTWPNLLAPSAPSSGMSHSSSLGELRSPKARPSSMHISLDTQPEGLGTLMEEEEEEDSASPVVVRSTADLSGRHTTDIEDPETVRRRQEAERETIKKTRRSSLQPRPLKLKSRPASLFVTPGMQKKAGLIVASPTLDLGATNEDAEEEARQDEQPQRNASADTSYTASNDSFAAGIKSPSLARDWSMAAAQAKALGSPTLSRSADSASATPPSSKPGIRALRLSSQSGMSTGSDSPTSSISTLPAIAQKRGSLLYNNGASPAQSDVGYGFPSSSSSGSLRRSSLIYKPASSDSVAPQASVSSFSPGVMAAMDELKAKNLRDAGALESLRRQVERLTAELASETERATRDYAQLERWSAEEKQNLCARIESLESDITETGKKLAEREDALKLLEQELEQHRAQAQEQLQDLEAERDMLQEDVDGWRTRCGDLEKTLKAERGTLEEERRSSHALRHRLQALVAKLREDGVEVPPLTPMEDEISERETSLPSDLASALRSPALDLSAGAGGYFSPRASPIDPPPQAVKLLKDMRQQIFNLAGSLDHERKQHLTAQQKADELQAENERLKLELEQARAATSQSAYEHDEPSEQPSPTRSLSSSGSSSFSGGRRGNGFVGGGKNKRHVFAYDSSMSSFDQSNTSMGSGATSVTSASDVGHSIFGSDEKFAGDFEDESNPAPNTADTLLPLGGLQPLAEEDEGVSSERETLTSSVDTAAPQSPVATETHVRRPSSLDLEAGEPCDAFSEEADDGPAPRYSSGDSRPSEDTTASYAESTDYDTPALEASASFAPTENDPKKTPLVSVDGKVLSLSGLSGSNSTRSSGTSSYETHGPASPVDVEAHADDASEDEEEEDLDTDDTVQLDRPEFIREWSFQEALRAVQVKGSGRGSKRSKSRKQRAPSIDDFFGLLLCEQLDPLPPLPTSKSSLEMPPVYVEQFEDQAPPYGEVVGARAGSISRQSGIYPSARQASVAGARRPPVARSAYVRDSVSSMESGLTHGTSNSASTAGSLAAGAAGMALASGLGSRTLSRMSLQGLTSAFSGLGGYLAGQSGAAVTAAAAATTMCSKAEMEAESRNASMSWTVQQRVTDEANGGDALALATSLRPMGGTTGAKRYSSTPAPRQSVLSQRQSHESARDQPVPSPRRFIQKWNVPAPAASPIWTLDFVPATAGSDDAVFSI